MPNIEFPENMHSWYPFKGPVGATPQEFYELFQFLTWAFGKFDPTIERYEAWNKLHPEYLFSESDDVYLSLCKMNYIYHNIYLKSVDSM
jgi:hypothetical protein